MKALLTLEDGFTLEGESFTGPIEEAGGEVIFNTAMCGYQELLTDPSYAGQMVCLTYPLIGNYGVNPQDMESEKVHMAALLVKECCKEPSNWRATESLPAFLMRHGVPGIEGMDTRALALHLRKNGSMRGCISTSILDPDALAQKARALPAMEGQNLVSRVAPERPYRWDAEAGKPAPATLNADGSYTWPGGQDLHVLVYDFGIARSVLRALASHGMELLAVPPSFTCEQARAVAPDAVFLSGGPGDPSVLKPETAEIAKMAEIFPMGAAGLGHQLLARALGGSTQKLAFGHHGCNYPAREMRSGRIVITTQNNLFCTLPPEGVEKTYVSLNDGMTEGFCSKTRHLMAVQFTPDSMTFFDGFREMVEKNKAK